MGRTATGQPATRVGVQMAADPLAGAGRPAGTHRGRAARAAARRPPPVEVPPHTHDDRYIAITGPYPVGPHTHAAADIEGLAEAVAEILDRGRGTPRR